MSAAAPDRRLIVIEGLPGSGHADFARWIGTRDDWYAACEEPHSFATVKGQRPSPLSPLLQRLLDRYDHAHSLVMTDMFRGHVVADHVFDTHLLWAKALLAEREWRIYQKIAEVIVPPPVSPDLVVYLQAPEPDNLAALRTLDKAIEPERWRELITAYNHHFFAYEASPLLVVRTQSSAWLSADGAREALWERIASFTGGKTYIIGEVDFWQGGDPTGD
ncbi:MAG: deoxynucleoside kinase [Candidatus Zixiibacteriota bacterium]